MVVVGDSYLKIGWLTANVWWLGLRVGGRLALLCFHQVNQVNSRNDLGHDDSSIKLGVTIYRCLQNRSPQYLVDCCVHTSDVSSHLCLRSANRHQLVVPRHCCSNFGRRSFSIAAPMVWNSFPYSLQDPTLSIDNRSALKTRLFVVQWDT